MTKTLEQMLAELPSTTIVSIHNGSGSPEGNWFCKLEERWRGRITYTAAFATTPTEALQAAINKMNGEG